MLSTWCSSIPFGEQNKSFGRQIIPEMGQNKSFGIQNICFGRKKKSLRIQNNSFGRQIIPEMGEYKSKTSNYFETNNASTKNVPRIDYKKNYSYHVSNQPKVSGCSENRRHSLPCLHSVCHKPRDREPSRTFIKLLKCRKLKKKEKTHACKGHTCFLCFIQYCYKL